MNTWRGDHPLSWVRGGMAAGEVEEELSRREKEGWGRKERWRDGVREHNEVWKDRWRGELEGWREVRNEGKGHGLIWKSAFAITDLKLPVFPEYK